VLIVHVLMNMLYRSKPTNTATPFVLVTFHNVLALWNFQIVHMIPNW